MLIHQNVKIYAGLFDGAEQATFSVAAGRWVYVHIARGTVTVNDSVLEAGDALQITEATALTLARGAASEVLVFDLPGRPS